MSSLYLAFSVVFPLFVMMALGYFLRAIHVFNEGFLQQLNRLCFQVFLPLTLFVSICRSDFKKLFSIKLTGFAVAVVLVSFLLLMVLVPMFSKDNRKRGVLVQGIFRSNFILFGIPISVSLYGEKSASVTAILIAFVIPLYNALSVVALEVFSPGKKGLRPILLGIVKNPLIIASACAFLVVLCGIPVPALVGDTLYDLSKVATPLALMVLGGSFRFSRLSGSLSALSAAVLLKLLFLPLFFLPIGILLGFRGMELTALLAMLASPTAVSSYTMAQNAGADGELAGQIVVVGSMLSVVTLFFWVTVFKALGFL